MLNRERSEICLVRSMDAGNKKFIQDFDWRDIDVFGRTVLKWIIETDLNTPVLLN
jgi:hypothetical protein